MGRAPLDGAVGTGSCKNGGGGIKLRCQCTKLCFLMSQSGHPPPAVGRTTVVPLLRPGGSHSVPVSDCYSEAIYNSMLASTQLVGDGTHHPHSNQSFDTPTVCVRGRSRTLLARRRSGFQSHWQNGVLAHWHTHTRRTVVHGRGGPHPQKSRKWCPLQCACRCHCGTPWFDGWRRHL